MTKNQKIMLGTLFIAAENLNIEKKDIQFIIYEMEQSLKDNKDAHRGLSINLFMIGMEKLNFFETFDEKEKFSNTFHNEIEYTIENYEINQKLKAFNDYDIVNLDYYYK